ncbi:hypothetical protein AURDEDRAFT_165146 [Auricularia subglabra TFB-10046 SS5]|nr:hypothetical protein AURDEDRAFT_165146 [Auricularia subglabra TFB-10046 SS5]
MTSYRHPLPDLAQHHGAFYAGVPLPPAPGYPLQAQAPAVPAPVQKKQPPAKPRTGAVKKRKAATVAATKKKAPGCHPLHHVYVQELKAIWAAYPRIPTVQSRRDWAAARGLEPVAVHQWFYRRKNADLSLPDYSLPVGSPPDGQHIQVKLENPVAKAEPSEPLLPLDHALSAAPAVASTSRLRKPSGRSQRSAIFVTEDDDPFLFLADKSPLTTSKWLQGLSDFGPFLPDDKPFPSVAATPERSLALLSSALDANPPAPRSIQPVPAGVPPLVRAAPLPQPSPSARSSMTLVDPLTQSTFPPAQFPQMAFPPSHYPQTAFHAPNNVVPPWVLPPPDCVMIPRALYASLAKAARVFAPEIFQQFPLYDFISNMN